MFSLAGLSVPVRAPFVRMLFGRGTVLSQVQEFLTKEIFRSLRHWAKEFYSSLVNRDFWAINCRGVLE